MCERSVHLNSKGLGNFRDGLLNVLVHIVLMVNYFFKEKYPNQTSGFQFQVLANYLVHF